MLAGAIGASLLSACASVPPKRVAIAAEAERQGATELRVATSHPSVLAARERLQQARERETIARADIVPEVSLTASETAYAGDVSTTTARSSASNIGASVALSLSRAFAGINGAHAARYATRAEAEAVRRSVDRTIVEIAVEKAGRERAAKTQKIRGEHKSQLDTFLARQKRRFGAGEISAAELETIRARLKFVEGELVRAGAEIAVHEAKLGALAGPIALSQINLIDLARFVPESEQQATLMAVSRNPTLREAEWLQDAASENVARARKNLLPDISVSFNTSQSDSRYVDHTSTGGNGSNVRVDLRVPLFDGGRRLAELRLEKSRLREQAYAAQAQKRSTESDVTGLWQGVIAARELQALSDSRIERSRRALSGTLEAERVGARSVDQVLDAYESLTDARLAAAEATAQLIVRSHELLATLGSLAEAYGAR